jgi:DNA-binding NarL/FixJ family response regulator
MTIRVVVDDQALVRAGFVVLVNSTSGMAVVGEAADGRQALGVCRSARPDIVLMDIRMPVMDGIEATRAICATRQPGAPAPRVVILTTFELNEYVYDALRHGASGFLLKDTRPELLVEGIRTVVAGDCLLAPSITRTVIEQFAHHAPPRAPAPGLTSELTPREIEVLIHVARGRSNAEISASLHISSGTTKTHIGRLLAKLEARDRAQLVIAAYESGFIRPGA